MEYGKRSNLQASFRRIILAFIDITLCSFSNALACFFVSGGNIFNVAYSSTLFNYFHFAFLAVAVVLVNYLFRLYKSVWSFAGMDEIVTCIISSTISAAALFGFDKVLFPMIVKDAAYMPFYAYALFFVFLVCSTVSPRIGYRIVRRELRQLKIFGGAGKKLRRVMIVGAGYMGNAVIEDLKMNQNNRYLPVVAVDDNPAKKGKRINKIKIAGKIEDIPDLTEKYQVDEIFICIPSATQQRINEILKIAVDTGKKVRISPSITDFIDNNDASIRKFREVEITDLLSRDEVKLNIKVCRYLVGKTILVTGGGGSIGSEICTQCARYNPETIVIFDIYENCAFELANELNKKYEGNINIQVRIGSVRDINRLEEVFEEFHPDVVFHAAAHKHVPLMEDSPCEAVKNNVFGTYNVAVTADKFKVPKMVILSTDKAVNPTNVMGTTKRITEIIVQYMNSKSENTKYAAVRFGNVLGSNGSVIPIFKKQIAEGGPVCVTHPDITRYFMTIPEAAQLVCQAGGLAKGGEVFVLDMGEPVRIMDLAENLIKLSGYTVEEIGIKITGLRPGEKLYEELSMESELDTREKTANEKIFVNQPMIINTEEFEYMLSELKTIDNDNVREKLQRIVPNYHPAEN